MATIFRNAFTGFTALTISLFSLSAGAVTLTPNTGWLDFSWSGGLGAIETYELTVGNFGGTIDLVDCCIIGDEFDLVITGDVNTTLSTTATNPADDGVQSDAFNGDDAWADGRLSNGSIFLAEGTYQLDLELTRNATGFTSGGGYIRVTSVPVPAAVWLFGSGLSLLGWFRRKSAA